MSATATRIKYLDGIKQTGGISCLDYSHLTQEEKNWNEQRAFQTKTAAHMAIDASGQPLKSPFDIDIRAIENSLPYVRLGQLSQFTGGITNLTRTRKEHTEDVVRTGELLAQALGLGEESQKIVKAICMMHDIGHPPYSHDGDDALRDIMLKDFGLDVDHDHAGLQILTEWDRDWHDWSGFNPVNALLSGAALRHRKAEMQKYGIEKRTEFSPTGQHITANIKAGELPASHFILHIQDLPEPVKEIHKSNGLFKHGQWNSIEGQVAAIADWITFTASDPTDLIYMEKKNGSRWKIEEFGLEPVKEAVATIKAMEEEAGKVFDPTNRKTNIAIFEEIRRKLINDVVQTVQKKMAEHKIEKPSDVKTCPELLVTFSPELEKEIVKEQSRMYKDMEENLELPSWHGDRPKDVIDNVFWSLFYGTREMVDEGVYYYDNKAKALRKQMKRLVDEGKTQDSAYIKARSSLAETVYEFMHIVVHEGNIRKFETLNEKSQLQSTKRIEELSRSELDRATSKEKAFRD